MSSKTTSIAWFFAAFLALLLAIHAPYLKLPYFWDELGQFVPASLDIFQLGAWIPRTTLPNVHPPAVMACVALVWKVFGYSIPAARVAMLVIAACGVLFSFLLAIRLSRQTFGAPAFAAVLFLLASPIFYTQAMMVQLDMPAMTLTVLALLLFLNDRFLACAIACTVLVLVKETAISTPFVLAAWLWMLDKKRREALYFLAPAIALGAWLMALHHATGNWLGNSEFARYNVSESLRISHIAVTVQRRLYFLFISDGLWIGAITMFVGSRFLRGREWRIAFTVAGAQLALVSIFGGASLDRYNLPALPIVYAAMAAAGSALPVSWRWVTRSAIIGGLLLGLFWNPPYPFSFENNLAMMDFIGLEQDAAAYLQANAPDKRIATAWPFTDALRRPEFGYVARPLRVEPVEDFQLASLANLDGNKADVVVVFSRVWKLDSGSLDYEFVQNFLERYWGYHPQATPDQIRAALGFVPVLRWTRHGQWIEIYLPEPRITGPLVRARSWAPFRPDGRYSRLRALSHPENLN